MPDGQSPQPNARLMPVIFFGMVLGVGGLASAWRVAARVWALPVVIGETLALVAVAIWVLWSVLYATKWLRAPAAALRELSEPTMAFIAVLAPLSAVIASLALKPHAPDVAWLMLMAGLIVHAGFTVWTSGQLWTGGRAPETTTPVIYMPPVGGCFISALGCSAFGYGEAALLYWGAGLVSWLVWESVVLQRLLAIELPVQQRATIGIHLTPPAVACLSYLSITEGPADRVSQMMFGYALLQAAIMLRLVPWLSAQPFSPASWAYTFGVAALSICALLFVEKGVGGPIAHLAMPVFVFANAFIGWIAVRTALLAARGTLMPVMPT